MFYQDEDKFYELLKSISYDFFLIVILVIMHLQRVFSFT